MEPARVGSECTDASGGHNKVTLGQRHRTVRRKAGGGGGGIFREEIYGGGEEVDTPGQRGRNHCARGVSGVVLLLVYCRTYPG